uniref:FZ domain-containing protein n=1 Tax=Arion vulgaris TaxID=1028688 RepID=A0A0B7BFR7_9EUPU
MIMTTLNLIMLLLNLTFSTLKQLDHAPTQLDCVITQTPWLCQHPLNLTISTLKQCDYFSTQTT